MQTYGLLPSTINSIWHHSKWSTALSTTFVNNWNDFHHRWAFFLTFCSQIYTSCYLSCLSVYMSSQRYAMHSKERLRCCNFTLGTRPKYDLKLNNHFPFQEANYLALQSNYIGKIRTTASMQLSKPYVCALVRLQSTFTGGYFVARVNCTCYSYRIST